MAREIVLDTETTGFNPQTGDRLIEIGCIEIEDLLPTGRTFYRLIDPCRPIPADAQRVHGIGDERVRGQPKFHEVAEELLDFIAGDPIVAHNAAFDRSFVNFELTLCEKLELHESRWIDTLGLAQKRFPGMHNSLDALCRRFKISLSERTLHGALVDARLLAMVYLELRGGKERALDLTAVRSSRTVVQAQAGGYGPRPRALPSRVSEAESQAHAAFLERVLKGGGVWAELSGEDEAAA
ncbi:MAG: DNA polymerase III subunit epsilon [Caulobacteraceae bacterium]|nr:DNA polymerase III subunit epsilon [Caulobacteraceae bacterium]